ncbi:hypothetical protein C8J57DRAFT_1213369 [Mycena rebaudengoi]|nr:hypothetical protein C8J57DRAFT_1213369 [Mycena rebaudengoi]
MPVIAFHLNHIPPRSLEPDESLPDPIELGWLNPDTSVVDTFSSYVVLNLDDRNNDRKLFRAYPAIVYDMVHAGTHHIPRYILGPESIFIGTKDARSPDHRLPTDELLRFTDIANHGSVPALPGMAIIELHGTHTPSSYPPLILICPEGFFQHTSSLSVDTVYNGRGFNIIRSELPLRLTSPVMGHFKCPLLCSLSTAQRRVKYERLANAHRSNVGKWFHNILTHSLIPMVHQKCSSI